MKAAQAALAIAEEKAYTARNDGFADGVSAQQEFEEKREAAANTVTGFFYVLNHKDDSDGLGGTIAVGKHYESLAAAQKALRKKSYKEYVALKVDAVYTVTPCTPPSSTKPSPKTTESKKSKPSPAVEVAPPSAVPVTAAVCDHADLKEIEDTAPVRYICTNESCGKILHTCLGCGDVFLPPATLGPEKVGFIHECAICGKDRVTRLKGLQVTDAKTDYHIELVDGNAYDANVRTSTQAV